MNYSDVARQVKLDAKEWEAAGPEEREVILETRYSDDFVRYWVRTPGDN